jgi:hypothetical protein
VKVVVLNGAAETVVVTRPRPAAAMVPRIRDRIYVSFWFFLRRMCFNAFAKLGEAAQVLRDRCEGEPKSLSP